MTAYVCLSFIFAIIFPLILQFLRYLDVIYNIVTQRGWLDSHFNDHCEKWLDLLIQLVDITEDGVERCLLEFFSPKLAVTKEFKNYIKDQVNEYSHPANHEYSR